MAATGALGLATSRSSRLSWATFTRAARAVTVVAALVPIGLYLYVALRRIGYPYELEWLEGGAAEIVRRAAEGHSLYVAPTLHFVPYPYTPLYFWTSAAVAHVVGTGFLPLRLVSLLSSLGALALLYRLVRAETGDRVAGLVAAGLFAATYWLSLAWLDIGRVDSMALLLTLLAVVAGRRALRAPTGPLLVWRRRGLSPRACQIEAGVVLATVSFLAFFTKQSALLALAPMLLVVGVRRPWAGLSALGVLVLEVVGSTVVMDRLTGGWYGYYVFDELRHQGLMDSVWRTFVPDDLLLPLSGALVLGVLGLALAFLRRRPRSSSWFWAAVVVGFVGSSWVARLHSGGAPDVLITAYAGVALLAGLGFAVFQQEVPALVARAGARLGARNGLDRMVRALAAAALAATVVVEVVALHYPVAPRLPNGPDLRAGAHLIRLIEQRPGEVIVLDHPWYETMAGKAAFAQGEAVNDILRAGPSPARTDLLRSIETTLASPGVRTVFLDSPGDLDLVPGLRRWFRLGPPVFACYQCFFPLTDLPVRPYKMYVRR